MAESFTRTGTARRLRALPGALLTLRRPAFSGGAVGPDPTARPEKCPCPSFLIEHDRGLVLFDSGVSPKGLQDPEGYFPELVVTHGIESDPDLGVDVQVRALGYRLDQIKYVVPSHLHYDHAGGLYLFPQATFFCGAGEMAFAYWPHPSWQPYFLLEDLLPTRGFNWVELTADHDLFGDGSVLILRTPGHTPGSIALLVRLPNRTILVTGDAAHWRVELEHGRPMRGVSTDEVQGHQSIQRLRALRESYEADVWISHDPDDWALWPHAPQAVE